MSTWYENRTPPLLSLQWPDLTALAYRSSRSVAREWWSTCVEYNQHFTAQKKWARKSTGRWTRCLWRYVTHVIKTNCLRREKATPTRIMKKHAQVPLEFLVGIIGTKLSWWCSLGGWMFCASETVSSPLLTLRCFNFDHWHDIYEPDNDGCIISPGTLSSPAWTHGPNLPVSPGLAFVCPSETSWRKGDSHTHTWQAHGDDFKNWGTSVVV